MAKLKVWDGDSWIEIKGDKGDPGAPGNDGSPGAKGEDGDPGPNPFHLGASPPADPETQPIWFDPES